MREFKIIEHDASSQVGTNMCLRRMLRKREWRVGKKNKAGLASEHESQA